MERKKRRQYTPMEQATVVRDVDELGVAGVTAVALAGTGLMQMFRGHALPAGWTLLWNGINLVRDVGSPPSKTVPPTELDS
jgi:hypothetical protein